MTEPTTWRIDTASQTLAFASVGDALPACVYWGPPLPNCEDLAQLAASTRMDITGGMLDAVAPISLSPAAADTFPGHPGMDLRRKGQAVMPHLRLVQATTGDGLTFTATDTALGLTYVAHFRGDAGGTIRASATLTTDGQTETLWLAAPVLPGPQQADHMIDTSGRWIREFQQTRTPWGPGLRVRDARLGRSGHEHPPFALFPETGATRDQGTVYAMHLGWSGGHRMVAEELPDGRRHIQWGKLPGSLSGTASGQTITHHSGDLLVAVSDAGFNGCAMAFQTLFRNGMPARRRMPRPVHYNCWEAIYFNHDLATLSDIADKAAAIGAERFVLDDGWFGRRDDDTTSLGDWTIDRRKWPEGLTPLIQHVHRLGMTFGLWFEPEMVNPDSDLYRAHPDWALGPADQTLGRHQMVLNMALPDVQDYLFDQIDAILQTHDIDYIKWDHNRLPPVTSEAQTLGTYALLARLGAAHPEVEIESCSSGGGRIDAGILHHCGRVWLSDSNDALERLQIQHDAAQWLPSVVTGSHVGPRHSHTSGRVLPMAFRAWVAAQRHMGFEMDLRELTPDETATLTAITAWFRSNRDWMHAGTILPLDSADRAVTAELQLAADGHRFVVFAGQSAASAQILPRPLRLTGLDATARYRVTLRNATDAPPQSRGPNALKSQALTLTGQALMTTGITLPVAWPATMWVVEGVRA